MDPTAGVGEINCQSKRYLQRFSRIGHKVSLDLRWTDVRGAFTLDESPRSGLS